MDSVPDNVQKLAQYFQDNIPYSYRPGATPYRADFINYFLGKNRRGYCAHFASAATLAFRYTGIPARYVEGYGIDPEDISEEGTIKYDQRYEDYYEGYSEVGKTAVVSANVTDASAHAWWRYLIRIWDGRLPMLRLPPGRSRRIMDCGRGS
ncbi:transglutaminase domain-containing protein [Clostridium sp. OM07-9AC]|nr:transglutaminase domain-containing protein [Clostridium sp. OM07-9AC]